MKVGVWTCDKTRARRGQGGGVVSHSRVGTIRGEEVLGLCMHTTPLKHMGPV